MKRILPLLLIALLLLTACQEEKRTSKRNKDDPSEGNILSGWLDNGDEEEEVSIETSGLIDRPQVTTTAPVESASDGGTTGPVSSSRQEALERACDYLRYLEFSYGGLIDQLEYEGYSLADATYAVDNCGVDWYAEAVKCAASYLDMASFTRSELIAQLEYEGYTYEQAVYGVDAVYVQSPDRSDSSDNSGSYDSSNISASMEEALETAKGYVENLAISYRDVIDLLEYTGCSRNDATYAADNCGADWYAEAAECAASYLEEGPISRSNLIVLLEDEGFTYDQAVYAATQNGL